MLEQRQNSSLRDQAVIIRIVSLQWATYHDSMDTGPDTALPPILK